MDGDVQAAVADGVVGAGEAATVTELGQDRGRADHTNAIEVGDQGTAAALAAGECVQRPVERRQFAVDRLQHPERQRDQLAPEQQLQLQVTVGVVGLRPPLPSPLARRLGRVGEMRPVAGPLDLLDHETPASRSLQCELGLTSRELLKPLPHRSSRRGHDPAPPNLTRLAVERRVRDLPSMHIQCDYDRHRDLLELRRHERHRVRNTLEPRRSHYMSSLWHVMKKGLLAGEGRIAADRDGLARLVLELGDEVRACLEMMSGALWVRDQLIGCGWQVEVADARKVKTVAPLAAKTDKVDARLLAELSRRELVPALWLPSLDERALRERLRRRMHLVRLRTSAKGRIFGLQTQWGVRVSLARLRRADGLTLLERAGVPEVWRGRRVFGADRFPRRATRATGR